MPKKTDRKLSEDRAAQLSFRIKKYTSQGFVSQRLVPPISQSELSQILARKVGCSLDRENQIDKILSLFDRAFSKFAA